MYTVERSTFESLVAKAVDNLPDTYRQKIDNIAFIVEDIPSAEQRVKLELANNQTLFGLYEGVPLPLRQGSLKMIPDKITIFQVPIESMVNDLAQLYDSVARTVWHEVAHYFGLDHSMIDNLNQKKS
jgi:predicted Zn-dependent protease with MMP-like domain